MLFKKKKKGPPEIPLSSTADVAFLLLIFFISTTVFDVNEALTLILPPKGSQVVKVAAKNVARIIVRENGSVTIDKQPIAVPDIEEEVRRRVAENEKLMISLETESQSQYGMMVKVLDQLKQAQVTRISLGLYKGE